MPSSHDRRADRAADQSPPRLASNAIANSQIILQIREQATDLPPIQPKRTPYGSAQDRLPSRPAAVARGVGVLLLILVLVALLMMLKVLPNPLAPKPAPSNRQGKLPRQRTPKIHPQNSLPFSQVIQRCLLPQALPSPP